MPDFRRIARSGQGGSGQALNRTKVGGPQESNATFGYLIQTGSHLFEDARSGCAGLKRKSCAKQNLRPKRMEADPSG